MDQMVLKAQQWVNATYRSVSGYTSCPENGVTGWPVIHSLIRALQHELGITALADAFGPATTAAMDTFGPVTPATSNVRMRTIVEAALYCKGYPGGSIDGSYMTSTLAGIVAMKDNMGLNDSTASLNTKHMKSLLSMDAYTVIWNGSSKIREAQQWLNRTYVSRKDFDILPCDGIFSRNVQKGLLYAIQYSEAMPDGTANGVFGPATQSGLRSQVLDVGSADSGSKHFVRLFKSALLFNQITGVDWSSTTYTTTTASLTKRFQDFCKLPTTGKGDYATWCSLLVSTGDPMRTCTGADCKEPLNLARITALKSAGYKTVGRYIAGGTQKVLSASEAALILSNGLSFFPIYQEYNNAAQYFTSAIGAQQATSAIANANAIGIPHGSVIYFSCDWDATADDVTATILPYFRGVKSVMDQGGRPFRVGIYATRNVCSMVTDAGLAVASFIAGMSTGWSGNLGFPLPDNWAFDQITGTVIAPSTTGELAIDKDVVSGRDKGVQALSRPVDPNDAFLTWLRWIEARATEWKASHATTPRSAQWLAAEYLRCYRNDDYRDATFNTLCGEVTMAFITWANTQSGRPDPAQLLDPLLGVADIQHFGAVLCACFNQTLNADPTVPTLHDFGGWAGDLVQVAGQYWKVPARPSDEASAYAWGLTAIGGAGGTFSNTDLVADVDAEVCWKLVTANTERTLNSVLEEFYVTTAAARSKYRHFLDLRFGDRDTATVAAKQVFHSLDPVFDATRSAFWTLKSGITFPLIDDAIAAVPGLFDGLSRAFVDVVDRLATP